MTRPHPMLLTVSLLLLLIVLNAQRVEPITQPVVSADVNITTDAQSRTTRIFSYTPSNFDTEFRFLCTGRNNRFFFIPSRNATPSCGVVQIRAGAIPTDSSPNTITFLVQNETLRPSFILKPTACDWFIRVTSAPLTAREAAVVTQGENCVMGMFFKELQTSSGSRNDATECAKNSGGSSTSGGFQHSLGSTLQRACVLIVLLFASLVL